MEELFEEGLHNHKKRRSNLPKFIKILGVIVFISLLVSFLKGFFLGVSGG